jgi:Na+(H+)/acetate symporter ActP
MIQPLVVGAIVAVAAATLVVGARGLRVARTPADFLVATRAVPPVLNASAISGEYLSAASFLGVAALVMSDGLGALWYAVGYLAGYLVLLAVIAAPLRRFGAYTIPDFAEGRLDSPLLRRVATVMVLLICAFYMLPQLKGAGITLQDALGGPYWLGVIVLGAVVTIAIASGGMKSITLAQAMQYWVKLTALLIPAVVLVTLAHHPPVASLRGPAQATFATATRVEFPDAETLVVTRPVDVAATGDVDGAGRDGHLLLTAGAHRVAAGAAIVFPAGTTAPHVAATADLDGTDWASPLVRIDGRSIHPLAATYGVIIATFLGALGLPHILVRFYTNVDGPSARRTTVFVLLLLSCFYVLPGIFAVLGRLEAPGLYVSGQTDTVVLALPRIEASGLLGSLLGALTAAGAFAAFVSTTSGLLIAMAGAFSHDILHRGSVAFRLSALGLGLAATACGLAVNTFSISVLVGWAFAIAASSFCPLLVLGIWWPRLTRHGALAGLVLGGGTASGAVLATMAGAGGSGWPAVLLGTPAIWTVPLAFSTMVIVSRLTPSALPEDVTGKLLALHLPESVRHRARPAGRARA